MDGDLHIVRQVAVPVVDAQTIQAQIEANLGLGLPEADAEPIKRLTIVANGPSAAHAPLDGPTLALNGALSLFTRQGLWPTYWAACDPQALVADFVDSAPVETTYLVASKCHPSVFARLAGLDVRLWHIDDHDVQGRPAVKVATSVTSCVLGLMRRMGYRAFDIYGWDCCYTGRRHHASCDEDAPASERDVTVEVDGRLFSTQHAWALEATEAEFILASSDFDATIHGDGLVRALVDLNTKS